MSCETTSPATSTTFESSKSLFSNILESVPLLNRVIKNDKTPLHSMNNLTLKEETQECVESLSESKLNGENVLSCDAPTDPRVDLLFKTVRGISREYLESLLEESWNISPRDTLRTMFYIRDCRGGKGERNIFFDFMVWLWRKDRTLFEKNIPCVPFYGSFKDLRKIMETEKNSHCEMWSNDKWALHSDFEKIIISYWCNVLSNDVDNLYKNETVSLAAKWVSIQDARFCKEMKLSHKLFRRMIRLLRERLDIVECKMSSKEWDKIYFEKVCSVSMKRYNNAFERHCESRFSEYLESVKEERKINARPLYPSDIAGKYLNNLEEKEPNETDDFEWQKLLNKCRSNLSNKKILCMVDTSGSMNGKQLKVAISLGLFMSELYPESKFYRKFITFSSEPKLQEIHGNNLCERVRDLQKSEWSMNTNLQKLFELVLNESTSEDHPDLVLILSDMNFDVACQTQNTHFRWDSDGSMVMKNSSSTNLEEIERKYKQKGLTRPRLVFWNLRSTTVDFSSTKDFPWTKHLKNCQLVNGYSPSLINSLLEEGDISPISLLRKTIDNPRYDLVYTHLEENN